MFFYLQRHLHVHIAFAMWLFKQLTASASEIFPYNTYLCKHRTNVYRGVICDMNKKTGWVLGRLEERRSNLNWIIYGCFTSERLLYHSIILQRSLEIKLTLHCLPRPFFFTLRRVIWLFFELQHTNIIWFYFLPANIIISYISFCTNNFSYFIPCSFPVP